MSNYYVLLLAVFICSATGFPANNNGRITGGGLASPGQFPYVVSVTEDGRHFCGGFIYSQGWIVTTASCVSGKSASKLKVVVGQQELTVVDPYEETISLYQIHVIDRYNSTTQMNDVALLQLMQNISFSTPDQVYFINYDEMDATQPEGTTIGWGATQEGGFESTKLRYASMSISNAKTCGDYTEQEFQTGIMFCADNSAATPDAGAPCQYDEGSPMIQTFYGKPVAVGIMSKNRGCSVDLPSVYTRLSVYYAWFLQVAGQQPVDSLTTTSAGPTDPNTGSTSTTAAISTTSGASTTTGMSSTTTGMSSTTTGMSSTTTEASTTTGRPTLTPTPTTREPITLPPDFTLPPTTTKAPIFTRPPLQIRKALKKSN
ncbi:transmembrane protease serine 9-like [Daphnia pulicaria]|uniref:transmembrane protease serine 9-like n=1 Tax=Daphnia pulicaria TaxID=35523 RepID=UPI001EEBE0DD|nr:transmembrane protease serine 9-like [Daphnia pulicaria]